MEYESLKTEIAGASFKLNGGKQLTIVKFVIQQLFVLIAEAFESI